MPSGVLFALFAYALYSCGDAIIKGLGGGLSVYEIAFFTTLFSLVPAFVTTPKGENWLYFWRAKHFLLLSLRGLSGMVGNLCIIYAFVTIPLAEAYSLAFLAPIFIVFISVWLLAEKVSLPRWMFLATSFIGVLIVVRPGFREIHLGHLAAVLSAMCGAVTTSTLRHIARDETRASLIGIASAYILVVNGVAILLTGGFHLPTLNQLAFLVSVGATGGLGSLLFIAATRRAPASMVAPVQYSQLFWALLYGAIFYAERPDGIAFFGLAAIIVAGVFNVLDDNTRIRIFSRLSPGGAGPATMEESETAALNATLAPLPGSAEAATQSER